MTETTRFIIAGTQRTGTTLLRTSLSSHPQIACHGEVFKLGKGAYRLPGGYWEFSRQTIWRRLASALRPQHSVRTYLNQLFDRQDRAAVGFKLMLNQCTSKSFLWPLIREHKVKSILVTRRNVLKTLVSRRTAAATGVYHVSPTLPVKSAVATWNPQAVKIDPQSLLDDLDRISNETAEWKRRLRDCEFIELFYEDYVKDQAGGNSTALDFLGAPWHALSSDLRKVNPDELGELISNFDEVASLILKSRYRYCLGSEN